MRNNNGMAPVRSRGGVRPLDARTPLARVGECGWAAPSSAHLVHALPKQLRSSGLGQNHAARHRDVDWDECRHAARRGRRWGRTGSLSRDAASRLGTLRRTAGPHKGACAHGSHRAASAGLGFSLTGIPWGWARLCPGAQLHPERREPPTGRHRSRPPGTCFHCPSTMQSAQWPCQHRPWCREACCGAGQRIESSQVGQHAAQQDRSQARGGMRMGAARPHSGLTAFRKWRTRPKYVDWSNCASSASRERNWQSTRAIARGQGAATERAPCRGVEASGRWEAHPGCWPLPALLRPGGCCPESRGLAVGLAATAGASTPIGAHRPGGGSGHELRTLTKSEWLRGLHCRQAAPQAPLWRRGDKRGRRLQSAARALEPLLLGVCSAAPHFAAGSCARPVQRRQPGQDGAWEPVRPARLVRTGSRRARGAAAYFGCAPLTSRAGFSVRRRL